MTKELTIEQIEEQIVKLKELKQRLKFRTSAKTADGENIVVGEKYYEIDNTHHIKIEEIIPQDDWEFDKQILFNPNNGNIIFYHKLYKDKQRGIDNCIKLYEEEVGEKQRALNIAQERLEEVKKLINN